MKNLHYHSLAVVIMLMISLFTVSCKQESQNTSQDNRNLGQETQLNLTFSSILKQPIPNLSSAINAVNGDLLTGELLVENLDSSTQETYNWSIYLNEDTFEAESNKTIVLSPGDYQFTLLLTKGDLQYLGMSSQTITDGENNIAMTIRPVIGESVTDVVVASRLADFKFNYDAAELSTAGFTNPQLGIIVDEGNESILSINPSTGITNHYINLPHGDHHIQLKLYEGEVQKGKSVAAQENVIVVPGMNLQMDLVSLHGETVFSLSEDGGDATFSFKIPAEVIDEAGGAEDLDASFSIVGPKNPLRATKLTLTQDASGDYEAEAVLSNYQFDEVTVSITFTDITDSLLLASCNMNVTLNSVPRALNCPVNLRRRAIVSGQLLGILYLNVFDTEGNPVAGATVSENDNILGITGTTGFGTANYFKTYLPAGEYTIRVDTSSDYGTAAVDILPLGTTKKDITLDLSKANPIPDVLKIGVTSSQLSKYLGYQINSLHHSVALATEQVNTSGGILGKQIELVVEDDNCSAAAGTSIANKMVSEGVIAFIGHYCRDATVAALPIYQENNILVVSPSTKDKELTDDYSMFFRTISNEDLQAQLQIQFISENLGGTRVAIVHDNEFHNKRLAEAVQFGLQEKGITIPLYSTIVAGKVDYSPLVRQVAVSDADVILLSLFYPEASKIVTQIKKKNVEAHFISGENAKHADFIKFGRKYVNDYYLSAIPDFLNNPISVQVYEELNARKQYRSPAGLQAYAAAMAIFNAMEVAGSVLADNISATLKSEYIDTTLGNISFDENGDLVGLDYLMYQVKNEQFVEIE